jgi:hypothetical protein
MASKNITLKQWECDSCGQLANSAAGEMNLPSGWIELTIDLGDMQKGIEVCQQCAKNPQRAKEAAKAKWGR